MSGKFIVGKFMVKVGCVVIDVDCIVVEFYEFGGKGIVVVVLFFGEDVFDEWGVVDCEKVVVVVFDDVEVCKCFEVVIYFFVGECYLEIFVEFEGIVVFEVMLLVEIGGYVCYEVVIIVEVDLVL